jgi:hypothetical protein
MFEYLTELEVEAVIAAAERNNAAHPPSKSGIWLDEGLELIERPDPLGKALKQTIQAMSPGARQELMALVWYGRGDSIDRDSDFATLFAEAKIASNKDDAEYIAEKSASLPMYLRRGLDRLKFERRVSK